METVYRDVRFGLRTLKKNPSFTFGAIAALTIGVSANVIVFSVANALILRPLPVFDPERVVRAYTGGYSNTLYPDYLYYRDHNQTLAGLAAFQGVPLVLRIDGADEHMSGTAVSGDYFGTLGVSAALGRVILPDDDRPGALGVVVLGHAYWQRRFGADAGIVGQSVTLNGHPFTVVGIAPSAVVGTLSPVTVDAWVPWNATVGLLRAGTLEQATGVSLLPLRVAAALAAALGVVALALAAVGIYGMTAFFVRQRTREVSIRLALGAEPSWIVRALTLETLRWTTTGLALGLATSLVATQFSSFLYDVRPTDPVAFAAIPALLVLTAYVACRVPASAATRVDPLLALRDE